MRIHREHFEPVEVIQDAFGELQSLARQKDIQYLLRVPRELPLAFSDPLRLRQVVINLLSNAIKFTEHGSVEAELLPWGERELRFQVRDTGVGIEEKAMGIIFERFRQVDGSMSRVAGGAGLGLAIVKQIVELLGGRIEVVSKPGEGSTFSVTLPLVAPDPEHGSAAVSFPPMPETVEPLETVEAALGGVQMEDAANGAKPLVLVVEDDADTASLLSETLAAAGYQVRVAANGPRGLDLARELQPSAITLDIMMPGMDGWRVLQALKSERRTAEIPVIVCSIVDNRALGYRLALRRTWSSRSSRSSSQRLRSDPAFDTVPIIALTAHALESDRERSLAAGCDEHWTKPILNLGDFRDKVTRIAQHGRPSHSPPAREEGLRH